MLLVKKIRVTRQINKLEDGNNRTRTTLKTIPKEIYKLHVTQIIKLSLSQ